MLRFFGMMPANQVEVEAVYMDSSCMQVRIEAGYNGWTVMYADYSTDYDDVEDTPENNFKKAYEVAVKALGPLRLL